MKDFSKIGNQKKIGKLTSLEIFPLPLHAGLHVVTVKHNFVGSWLYVNPTLCKEQKLFNPMNSRYSWSSERQKVREKSCNNFLPSITNVKNSCPVMLRFTCLKTTCLMFLCSKDLMNRTVNVTGSMTCNRQVVHLLKDRQQETERHLRSLTLLFYYVLQSLILYTK